MALTLGRGSLLAFLTCVLSFGALAQTTGELTGRVTDSTSVPIAGALIEVSSPSLIRPRQTATDKDGHYRMPLLPPGTYEVMARMTGFVDAVRKDIRIPLGETITVPLRLTVTAAASVEVDTTPPLLDVENAKAGITVNQTVLSNLPLGRNYASAAVLVPGTGFDSLGPTFYGASSLENTYQIDGVNTTAPKLGGQGRKIPLDFVLDTEIRSGGYEAEYGKSLGGNINVITKSGGNDFHGDLFGYYDSDSLGAADQHEADRPAVGLPPLEVPRQYDVGLSLGGPVVRDRIWFFGAYDRAQTEQGYRAIDHYTFSPAGVPTAVYEGRTERAHADLLALNLSWMPASTHFVNLSIFGDPGTSHGRTGPFAVGPPSATVIENRTGGTDVSARWTGFLGKLVAEAQYGYHSEDRRQLSDFADVPNVTEYRSGVWQFAAGSGPAPNGPGEVFGALVDETYRRNVYAASGTLLLGSHELKFGGGYELENPNRTARFSGTERIWNYFLPDGTYAAGPGSDHLYFAKTPVNCIKLANGQMGNFGYVDGSECLAWEKVPEVRSDFRTRRLSAFVQDSWRPLSNLTVKAGLRYDYEVFGRYDGSTAIRLSDQWSPRLSAAWDPSSSGRAKVFASYGRYYQSFPQFLQSLTESGELATWASNDSPGIDPVGFYYPDSPIYPELLPDDLKGMYQDEISAGLEMQLSSTWAIGLRGIYRSLGRGFDDRCDRDDPSQGISDLFPPQTRGCAIVNPGEGQLGQFRDPTNPDCFEDYPVNQKPKACESVRASRFYRAIELTIHNRPTKDLYLQASYVYSRLEGSYQGLLVRGVNGFDQATPGWNQEFDYPSALPNNFGRLPNDRTHQAKFSGFYTLPFGLTAGVIAQYWSGQPLSVRGASHLETTTPNAEAFLAPRGTYGEMPSTYNIDFHLHYALAVGSVTVSPSLDVFNLTNVQRALGRNQIYNTWATRTNDQPPFANPTNPNFGKDVSWQVPRLVRLGMKVAF